LAETYSKAEFLEDLFRVSGEDTNRELAQLTVNNSRALLDFYQAHGVAFQPALTGTLSLSKSNAFFLGGGRAMLNALYRAAERQGVAAFYDSEIMYLGIQDGAFRCATIAHDNQLQEVRAGAIVVASGGFEANTEWLQTIWGPGARNFAIRGTPYNTGKVLRLLFERGAQEAGDARQFHAVAVDARAPKFDGGIATRLDCIPFGIVVDTNANRFYDEGEDLWPKRYAIWGRLITQLPDQRAFVIFDSRVKDNFIPALYAAHAADKIPALAQKLGLDPRQLSRTVDEFNRNVVSGTFDPSTLDDCRTSGLEPAKSHWAQRIEAPPFFAYPLQPGITFTYLGVAVDRYAKVQTTYGPPYRNVFAAGEAMAGSVLKKGYIAGIGMTIGGVFGRIAGTGAARLAKL